MNAAIRDPAKVKCDETLYAVLLLSGYEVRVLQLRSWLKFLQPTLMNADVVIVIDNHVRFRGIIRGVPTSTALPLSSETVAGTTSARLSHATCFFLSDGTR
jgi:hypothetical protein